MTGRSSARPGTEDLYRDAWFVGAIPQLVAAVWVGFPQGQIPMQYPTTRIKVFGGTWPAQIWHAFMYNATKNMPIRDFPQPSGGVDYVTVKIDVTQGCVANQFTPPGNIQTLQFIAGTEPTKICREPTAYQYLMVPSVIGMKQNEAVSVLRGAGFNVAVELVPSDQPSGTVVAQEPDAGTQAQQTSTVTISVAEEASPTPELASVPDVIGASPDPATAQLHDAGFRVAVAYEEACDPSDPDCDYGPGVVWAQSPGGGSIAEVGSTVTIVVNP